MRPGTLRVPQPAWALTQNLDLASSMEVLNQGKDLVNQAKNATDTFHEVTAVILSQGQDLVNQGKDLANQAKNATDNAHQAMLDRHKDFTESVATGTNMISGLPLLADEPVITLRALAETEETEDLEDFQVTDGLEYLVVDQERITIRALEEDEENQQEEPQMLGISIPIDVVKREESPFFQDLLEGKTLSSNVLLQVLTNPSLTYSSYEGSDLNQGDHACKTPVTYMLVDQPLTLSADQMADFMIQVAKVTMHEPNELTLLRNSIMMNEKCKVRTGLGLTATMSLIGVAIFATVAMLVGGFLFYRWQKSRDALNSRRQARGIPVVHTV